MKKTLTAREVWSQNRIYWIKSYKVILKYIGKEYRDIFQPIEKGSATSKRYYIPEKNVDKFVEMFENSEL